MNHVKKTLGLLLALIVAAQLAACSKTVQWEEEVPLNTGETIWVKRTVVYSYRGAAGNPFDMGYRPKRDQAIEFAWNRKNYYYKGDARIMLLAISPQKIPVLVANASDNSWNLSHDYHCTIPYYVEFIPDGTGKIWIWPSKIDTWLYNIVPNLLLERHPPNQMKRRYTTQERNMEDKEGASNAPWQQKIDPIYTGDNCKRRDE